MELDKILSEGLAKFNVPSDVLASLKEKILILFQRPERKPSGAAVMTAEASMAADRARKGLSTPADPKPRII